jgi:ABC-type Fe3+/spermidine/putrescine transport system ATPase subunit
LALSQKEKVGRQTNEHGRSLAPLNALTLPKVQPILELRGVSKDYSGHTVLDGISLAVPQGSFFALLGPSGCGKTTMLRLTAGFEEPTAGEIYLHGQPMNGRKPYERKLSTVFQNFALFPHLSVWQNIEFGLRHQNIPDRANRIAQALDLVQLRGKESHYPAQISGGEKQRTALARSLVLEPNVLLLDEPLSSLDPALRKLLRNELKSLQRRVGIAFLMVTHDQEEALSVSDQIAVMHHGRIQQVGTPEEIYLRPSSRFVAGFVGAVNWIDGVGVRPEATTLSRQRPNSGARAAPATVVQSLFLGSSIQVQARLADGATVSVSLPRRDDAYQPGEAVFVCWNRDEELSLPAEPS